MLRTKKIHNIGKIKQLIDLNGDSTNFNLKFTASCKNKIPFNLLVVDQATLDNTEELVYKTVNDTITGTIVADKNFYQNYFLILKSDDPCEVEVEFEKTDLPITHDSVVDQIPQSQSQSQPQPQQQQPQQQQKKLLLEPEPSIPWTKVLLIGVVVVAGIALLYYFYKRDKPGPPLGDTVHPPLQFDDKFKGFNSPIREHSSHTIEPVVDLQCESSVRVESHSPVLDSVDHRTFKPNMKYPPKMTSRVSPDVMSRQSSYRSDDGSGGLSLIERLKRFSE
jgi:hypothetical protein